MIEGQTLVRHVLTVVLTERLGCRLVASCGSIEDGIRACLDHHPDLVILDWMLPDGSAARLLERLVPRLPSTRWLALSANENAASIRLAIAAGAHGFVMKQSGLDDFETALRRVLAGQPAFCPVTERLLGEASDLPDPDPNNASLTSRERDIITLYARGHNPKAIAGLLGVSPKTVQNQLTSLKDKLGMHEPATLVRFAFDHGFV